MAAGPPTVQAVANNEEARIRVQVTLNTDASFTAPETLELYRRVVGSQDPRLVARWAVGAGNRASTQWALSDDNPGPRGAAADDTHIWVPSSQRRRVLAYTHAGARASAHDFTIVNYNARGVAFVGSKLYVVDEPSNVESTSRMYVYEDGVRDNASGFAMQVGEYAGLWTDGTTLWTTNKVSRKIEAYDVASRSADTAKEHILVPDNRDPSGLGADSAGFYVTDATAQAVFVYNRTDGSLIGRADLDPSNTEPRGIVQAGSEWHVVNALAGSGNVFVYKSLSVSSLTNQTVYDYFAGHGVNYAYQAVADGVESAWVS